MDLWMYEECEDCERDIHDIFIYLLDCKNAFPVLTQLMSKMSTTARREILLKEMVRFLPRVRVEEFVTYVDISKTSRKCVGGRETPCWALRKKVM